jgi:aminomuconate-semialdehyde/2-hydroxymuconate-6-semialdehyde dehydrogenase
MSELIFKNYLNGRLSDPSPGKYMDVYDPSVGKVFAKVASSGMDDVSQAVQAAQRAFPEWSNLSSEKRSNYLFKIADLIDQNHERLALAESRDNGKPTWLARMVDIPRASSNFRFFATAGMQFSSESHSMDGRAINYTLRPPLGVVGCISPWNLPLYLFTWKIAPALAVGNTVVAKPSEVTPYTAYLLSELCIEAGLPPGVLNIIHGEGPEVGAAITSHPDIKAVSFTGSTRVGREIASVASPMFKKISLEMGGKNPNIIFADCNYDKMLSTTIRSSFANQGQICLCGSRIYVEESIYEKFKIDFVEKTKRLKIGPPGDDSTKVGAVVSESHLNKILSYVKLAQEEGGQILVGGKREFLGAPHENGFYVQPTIIEGLTPDCRVNQEEIFGPVVTIMPFRTEEEVLGYANDIPYGLSSTLWTSNLTRAHRMAARLEAGIVWINTWLLRDLRTPFGGVKNSGVGREGGLEALRFFTEPKNVCIDYSE